MNTSPTPVEVRRYSMVIEWSDDDDAYIVTVPELPGCRTHGATRAEAVAQGEEVVAGWIEDVRADGEPVPQPRPFARRHAGLPV